MAIVEEAGLYSVDTGKGLYAVNFHTVGMLWETFERVLLEPKAKEHWSDFTDLAGIQRSIISGVWQGWMVYKNGDPQMGALTTLVVQPALTEIHWLWVGGIDIETTVPYFHAINNMARKSGARRVTALIRPGLLPLMEKLGFEISPKYWVELDMPDERIH